MLNVIQYWRNSLADADRLNVELDKLPSRQPVAYADLEQGVLPPDVVQNFFQKDDDEEKPFIDVLLAPIVAYGKTEHGERKGNTPKELVPLWVPARLNKDGNLQPSPDRYPWIPRNFLEPCPSNLPALGTVEDLDLFLSSRRLSWDTWEEYWKFAVDMFRSVTGQPLATFAHESYMRSNMSLVAAEAPVQGMARFIINLYDDICGKRHVPPLLKRFASLTDEPVEPLLTETDFILKSADHLGQMGNEYPVSESQREAIHHVLTLHDGEMLAVNGPPGTGKTTMLQSIISTLWIQAAYEKAEPPVILVASTNNQAVTNVIDSFGSVKERANPLEGRWLPNLVSYGLYLASTRQEEKPGRHTVYPYQRDEKIPAGFPRQVEALEYVAEAEAYFLEKSRAFANTAFAAVQEAVEYLHEQLKQTVDELREIVHSYCDFVRVNQAEAETYPQGIDQAIALKQEELARLQAEWTDITQQEAAWNQHLYTMPWWFTVLNVFPFKRYIEEKRRLRNRMFFLSRGLPEMEEEAFSAHIQHVKQERRKRLDTAQRELEAMQQEQQWFQAVRNRWSEWKAKLGGCEEKNVLDQLDTSYRYRAFKLATHYWEGRWLLQMRERFASDTEDSRGKAKQVARWKRYAKLTPCFVSTLHMTPKFFSAWEGESLPLYECIDLLIIDEAGQVSPEVAGAAFALAKKALVVGDTLQIEPVWNIPAAVDLHNIVKFRLVDNVEEANQLITETHIGASNGSVMQIAQRQSKYQKFADTRGMYLTEHRRCVPEIIAYCNELAYQGRLIPKRERKENHPLPHMGYAHVRGAMERAGGSWRNATEAEVIVRWLLDNQARLEEIYPGHELGEIVAVVTPFSAQRQLMQSALARAGIQKLTVGTVHALQGAERPIVIFSPVYDSSKESGYFFDKGIQMLNVAVSRAKDSFLVFGDMQIFSLESRLPSGVLAKYLFADERNEIQNIRIPSRALSHLGADVQHIRDLEEHRQVLKECIVTARREVHIVSPFLSSEAITADRLQEAFAAAVQKGIRVTVYADPKLNEQGGRPKTGFVKARDMLREEGVHLVLVERVHNKTLWVDDRLLIEGSFNWLSARRSPDDPWCRYEASLLYRGKGVAGMIQQIGSDLRKRTLSPTVSR